MKKNKYTEKQIVNILQEATEVARRRLSFVASTA